MKIIVIALIVAILIALGLAMISLLRGAGNSKKTVNALTLRVALSVGLFLLLMLSFKMGWIQPHSI